jgi:hypothetical protein
LQVFPLLAKSVRSPRHAAHSHPDAGVLALDMANTNPVSEWSSHDLAWDRIHDLGRAVPLFAFARYTVDLCQLREVHPITQQHFHGLDLGLNPSLVDWKRSSDVA